MWQGHCQGAKQQQQQQQQQGSLLWALYSQQQPSQQDQQQQASQRWEWCKSRVTDMKGQLPLLPQKQAQQRQQSQVVSQLQAALQQVLHRGSRRAGQCHLLQQQRVQL
jgi:hypothetical protein